MVKEGASDGFISALAPPSIKVDGTIFPITEEPVTPEEARELVFSTMNDKQTKEFIEHSECNFAMGRPELGRFRVSCFVQRGECGLVVRRIVSDIPEIEDLGLPPIVKELAMTKRGLVIFVGATGTGKSTSLAAMIGERNHKSSGHIITYRGPHRIHPQACWLHVSLPSGKWALIPRAFDVALKNTLRQAPDVIMIGEVRYTQRPWSRRITFRRNRSPVPVYPARQQRQPGAGPDTAAFSPPSGTTRSGWTSRSTCGPWWPSSCCRSQGRHRQALP